MGCYTPYAQIEGINIPYHFYKMMEIWNKFYSN
jgi:hypothetical protein